MPQVQTEELSACCPSLRTRAHCTASSSSEDCIDRLAVRVAHVPGSRDADEEAGVGQLARNPAAPRNDVDATRPRQVSGTAQVLASVQMIAKDRVYAVPSAGVREEEGRLSPTWPRTRCMSGVYRAGHPPRNNTEFCAIGPPARL